MEKPKTPVPPSLEAEVLEAAQQDDTLKSFFAGDEEVPVEGTVETPEPDPVEDTSVDGEETEVEQPAEDQTPDAVVPDEVDISDLLTPDGDVDLDKLKNERKSRLHAQKLIGKTAKDREELNRLKAVEEKLQQLEATRISQPETKAAEAPVSKLSVEELNAKVIDMYREGRVVEAQELIDAHNVERQKLVTRMQQLEADRQTELRNAEQRQRYEQEQSFRKAHIEDGLFKDNGEVKDKELFDEMVKLVQYKDGRGYPIYAAMGLDDVHHLARMKLKRSTTPPAKDATKARLVSQSTNKATRPVARAAARQKDEILPGLTSEDIEAVLGGKS